MQGHTIENSSAIIDFDRTITFWSYPCIKWGKRLDLTSYSVFEKYRDIDPVFLAELNALYEKYIVIERDPNVEASEKAEKMLEWPVAVYKLYWEYITKDILDDALEGISKKLKIREWMKEFLDFLTVHNIPVLIYSAGISNVIDAVLEKNNLSEDILIHGNTLKFDDKWRFIIPEQSDILHVENKIRWSLPENKKREFKWRTHMFVMWDSTWDPKMWPEYMKLHKIWFQLETNRDAKGFSTLFDKVIKSEECDEGYLKEVTDYLKRSV